MDDSDKHCKIFIQYLLCINVTEFFLNLKISNLIKYHIFILLLFLHSNKLQKYRQQTIF